MSQAFACALDAWLAAQCGARHSEELPACLARAQFQALSQTLTFVRNHSRYYARTLSQIPAMRSLVDLAKLPLTPQSAIKEWQSFLTCPLDAIERMVTLTTSGTTGPPKRLAFSRNDLARTRDFFAHGMRFLVAPGMSVCVLLPGASRPNGVSDLLSTALSVQNICVHACPEDLLSASQAPRLASWLQKLAPDVLVAMPAYLKRLWERDCQLPSLTGLLSSAEPLDDALREALSHFWHCEILDHYGMTETGYGLAVECPAHDGLHLRALDVLVEIVDGKGNIVPIGEEGEIVVTTLAREAMPLIRYRTGDMGRLLAGPCACQSPLKRLARVRGRIKETNGTRVPVRMTKGEGWPKTSSPA